jgi:AcrR family transcriptional regulator
MPKTNAKPSTKSRRTSAPRFDVDQFMAAVLDALATTPWSDFTPAALALSGKFDQAEILRRWPDKHDLAAALVDYFSRRTAAELGSIDARQPARDRLFDVLMTRLDSLQQHRPAVLNLMRAVPRDPRLVLAVGKAQWQAMGKMLDLAGLAEGAASQLKISALTGLYGLTLCRWMRDETPDLAKTMALLDRLLRQANKAAEVLLRLQK